MISELEYFDLKLGLYDTLVSLLYFGLVYILAFHYKRKKIKTNPVYKYFILGLTSKVFGGLAFGFLIVYYYGGGDSLGYYKASLEFSHLLFKDPIKALDLFFTNGDYIDLAGTTFNPWAYEFINGEEIFFLVKITTLLNILALHSYGSTTVLFASISFLGLWFAFSNFCKIYPRYKKHLFISFFMLPSIMLWGSGILKDTVTLGCIGWLIYSFSNIFIFKRKILLSIIITIVAIFMIKTLKPYILYILLPSLLIWGQTNLKNLIKGSFIRIILIPSIVLTISIGTFYALQGISSGAGRYDINNLERTLEGFQSWHGYLAETRDQSGYTLGEIEFTPIGYLKSAPAAFNVTFFRPYIWEIRNVATLMGALESLFVFLFFMYLILKFRWQFFKIIFQNKDILFMMIFSILFGISVGISSYNFGALSRYKMPAQLLFVTALFLIYNIARDEKKTFRNQ